MNDFADPFRSRRWFETKAIVIRFIQGCEMWRRTTTDDESEVMPSPQLTTMRAALRDAWIARRERTRSPIQALLLFNQPESLKAARGLARRTFSQSSWGRLDFVQETVTPQMPDQSEKKVLNGLLAGGGVKRGFERGKTDEFSYNMV